jgi:hypothetical protein
MRKFRIAVLFLVLTAGAVCASYGMMDINLPEGTKFLLYVRDIKNVEDDLRRSGVFNLPSDHFDYLIEYLGDKQPALDFYKDLKSMDDGAFIKSLIGETAILNVMNDTLVAIRLQKTSSYFSRLMDIFNVKGSFNGYYVDFQGDKVLLSRNKAAIAFYKNAAAKRSEDPVLNNQVGKDREADILFYKTGDVLFHPWFDAMISKNGEKKSFSIALNIQKKSLSIFSSPRVFSGGAQRVRFPGQTVQSTVLTFVDSQQNIYDAFEQVFGKTAVSDYEKSFRENFENQTSFALTGFSPQMEPSFLIAARPKSGKADEAQKTLNEFLNVAVGENEWSKQNIGGLTVLFGKKTGLYSYLISGLYVLSDSRDAVAASADVFSGKSPSIWDNQANAKLKDLMDKPAAYYIDLADISDKFYNSMLKSLTLTSLQKEDLRIFMRSVKDMGSLVGYAEDKKTYNYYYFVLKGSK